jgi:hypothetical protein
MSKSINRAADWFWNLITVHRAKTTKELMLALITSTIITAAWTGFMIMSFIELWFYDYPTYLIIEWFGVFIVFVIEFSALIDIVRRYVIARESKIK